MSDLEPEHDSISSDDDNQIVTRNRTIRNHLRDLFRPIDNSDDFQPQAIAQLLATLVEEMEAMQEDLKTSSLDPSSDLIAATVLGFYVNELLNIEAFDRIITTQCLQDDVTCPIALRLLALLSSLINEDKMVDLFADEEDVQLIINYSLSSPKQDIKVYATGIVASCICVDTFHEFIYKLHVPLHFFTRLHYKLKTIFSQQDPSDLPSPDTPSFDSLELFYLAAALRALGPTSKCLNDINLPFSTQNSAASQVPMPQGPTEEGNTEFDSFYLPPTLQQSVPLWIRFLSDFCHQYPLSWTNEFLRLVSVMSKHEDIDRYVDYDAFARIIFANSHQPDITAGLSSALGTLSISPSMETVVVAWKNKIAGDPERAITRDYLPTFVDLALSILSLPSSYCRKFICYFLTSLFTFPDALALFDSKNGLLSLIPLLFVSSPLDKVLRNLINQDFQDMEELHHDLAMPHLPPSGIIPIRTPQRQANSTIAKDTPVKDHIQFPMASTLPHAKHDTSNDQKEHAITTLTDETLQSIVAMTNRVTATAVVHAVRTYFRMHTIIFSLETSFHLLRHSLQNVMLKEKSVKAEREKEIHAESTHSDPASDLHPAYLVQYQSTLEAEHAAIQILKNTPIRSSPDLKRATTRFKEKIELFVKNGGLNSLYLICSETCESQLKSVEMLVDALGIITLFTLSPDCHHFIISSVAHLPTSNHSALFLNEQETFKNSVVGISILLRIVQLGILAIHNTLEVDLNRQHSFHSFDAEEDAIKTEQNRIAITSCQAALSIINSLIDPSQGSTPEEREVLERRVRIIRQCGFLELIHGFLISFTLTPTYLSDENVMATITMLFRSLAHLLHYPAVESWMAVKKCWLIIHHIFNDVSITAPLCTAFREMMQKRHSPLTDAQRTSMKDSSSRAGTMRLFQLMGEQHTTALLVDALPMPEPKKGSKSKQADKSRKRSDLQQDDPETFDSIWTSWQRQKKAIRTPSSQITTPSLHGLVEATLNSVQLLYNVFLSISTQPTSSGRMQGKGLLPTYLYEQKKKTISDQSLLSPSQEPTVIDKIGAILLNPQLMPAPAAPHDEILLLLREILSRLWLTEHPSRKANDPNNEKPVSSPNVVSAILSSELSHPKRIPLAIHRMNTQFHRLSSIVYSNESPSTLVFSADNSLIVGTDMGQLYQYSISSFYSDLPARPPQANSNRPRPTFQTSLEGGDEKDLIDRPLKMSSRMYRQSYDLYETDRVSLLIEHPTVPLVAATMEQRVLLIPTAPTLQPAVTGWSDCRGCPDFSPDGTKLILLNSTDRQVCIGDVETHAFTTVIPQQLRQDQQSNQTTVVLNQLLEQAQGLSVSSLTSSLKRLRVGETGNCFTFDKTRPKYATVPISTSLNRTLVDWGVPRRDRWKEVNEEGQSDSEWLRKCICSTFSPDNNQVLISTDLWDLRTESKVASFEHFNRLQLFSHPLHVERYPMHSSFHPNGRHVLIQGEIWDLRNTDRLVQVVPHLVHTELGFSASGETLFSLGNIGRERHVFTTSDSLDYSILQRTDVGSRILDFVIDRTTSRVGLIQAVPSMASVDEEVHDVGCTIYGNGRGENEGKLWDPYGLIRRKAGGRVQEEEGIWGPNGELNALTERGGEFEVFEEEENQTSEEESSEDEHESIREDYEEERELEEDAEVHHLAREMDGREIEHYSDLYSSFDESGDEDEDEEEDDDDLGSDGSDSENPFAEMDSSDFNEGEDEDESEGDDSTPNEQGLTMSGHASDDGEADGEGSESGHGNLEEYIVENGELIPQHTENRDSDESPDTLDEASDTAIAELFLELARRRNHGRRRRRDQHEHRRRRD
ncbi:hypothetical protein BLNAU_3640 [Blattamonas nauphoetae]|uniref:Uncharacterized protein n=1 Tax=Blattamonas nauphoetae TaxID=2049346 RepID=A0ABQ9YCL6_9EUKA|nr:hypothetical protein BLNAU_3640 [Blattamonas nauphoetae]